jgi:primosomal protein N' (replication factor Y)
MPPASEPALQVALPLPLPPLDYLPPAGMDATADWIGRRVRVPMGRRELVGWVVGVGEPAAGVTLRPALALLDEAPLLTGELLASLRWAAQYYQAPLGEMLATALPATLRQGEPLPDTARTGWRLTEAGATARTRMRPGAPRRLADALAGGALDAEALDAQLPGWRAAARALQARGAVETVTLAATAPTPQDAPYALNADQRACVDALARVADGFAAVLIEGVTGSGKTEVYLEAMRACLAAGRQALLLVPEIGLTPQALQRLRVRLGVPVLAQHSGLADGERARTWAALWRGEAGVLVGTR